MAAQVGVHTVNTADLLDRGRLARDLQTVIKGEVRFDEGSRALYANDASIYRQVPLGVVLPYDAEDVVAALSCCHERGAPVFGRGGGTGLAGQSVNAAVLFDFSKYMNRVVEIDEHRRTARVQPGVLCDQLRDAARRHGLTFAPDPATHDRCTLGGMIGNNSCGTHSLQGGKTVDNVVTMDVVTFDGVRMTVGPTSDEQLRGILAQRDRRAEIYRDLLALRDRYAALIRSRYPDIPRRVSGYNLDELLPEAGFNVARALVGTESTCVFVLEAEVRLLARPARTSLLVAGFPDAATAADHTPELASGDVIGLECFDAGVLTNLDKHGLHLPGMDQLPDGDAWLLVEYGAETHEQACAKAHETRRDLRAPAVGEVFESEQGQAQAWEVRRSTIEYTRIPGEHSGLAGWEDAAVAPEQLGDYIRDYCALVTEHGYHTVLFGHFGQGCMHNRLDLELGHAAGIDNFRRFIDRAGDLVVGYGGSLSGEHGDGQLRGRQLTKMFGAELVGAFERFKAIWDPGRRMNPGKVVHAYAADENLALATTDPPRDVHTHFAFPADENGFADAVNRCFGVGKCRHYSGGTMCPSFMVTGEEEHSTRGRSRLLFEMMHGHLGPGSDNNQGWRDEHVKDALDLCLACKGCKGECPVEVDVATYKAEFLAHYFAGRLRPRSAYALGLIPVWARAASLAPRLVNAVVHAPGLNGLAKAAAGVAPRRSVPTFASATLRSRVATPARRALKTPGTQVLLWPDTFTNYFSPEVGVSAVRVLRDAGFTVRLPRKAMCCGRPLYDYGMLPTAKRWLARILDELETPLAQGWPIVVLEPSCLAVFRDELRNLYPDDRRAHRLAENSHSFAELLSSHSYQPPKLRREVLLQTHCHQHAVVGEQRDGEIMGTMGLTVNRPDTGCCGMAGSFGYERGDKYDVSVAAGERVLLPAVRQTPADHLILADGFSCREQITHGTDRQALHLAQVVDLGLRERT